jgi:Helix-turn-helix domain
MSFQAVAWAIEVRVGDPILKNLLMAICHHADRETWSCWPSQDLLAFESEVSKRTIQRKLEELQERGFLRIEKRRNQDGTQANSRLTVTGGQAVTLSPPVDKEGLTGGQKGGSPGDTTCPPVKKQEEQEEQSIESAREKDVPDLFEIPPAPRKSRKKPATGFPSDFSLTDTDIAFAIERGFSSRPVLQNLYESFRSRHQAKGTIFSDWHAAWRNWVLNEIKFGRSKKSDADIEWRPI